jgi:desulfoferrodoxin (superoxide reductase-like protein)
LIKLGKDEEKMKSRILAVICAFVLCSGIFWAAPAMADKAAVAIEAPASAAKGAEITIRLTITHSSNADRHHVEWVKIWVNNLEVQKWVYSPSNLPEGVPFTREVKAKASEDLEIKAEASCNIHGSKGPAVLKIVVK